MRFRRRSLRCSASCSRSPSAMAVSRFDARKQALVDETNAIGTAYLRVQLLPPGQQAAAADDLPARMSMPARHGPPLTGIWMSGWRRRRARSSSNCGRKAQTRRRRIHGQSPTGLYVQSLNDMFDAQSSSRRRPAEPSFPATTLFLLISISTLSVGILGYRSGIGGGRSLTGAILLPSSSALVVLIILDLDQPYQGSHHDQSARHDPTQAEHGAMI